MNYYSSPVTFQRGHGLGNVLSKIFRSVVPFFKNPNVKKGVKRIGTAVLNTGLTSLQDNLNKNIPLRKSLENKVFDESRKLVKELGSSLKRKQEGSVKSKILLNQKRRKFSANKRKKTRKLDVFDFS